MPHGTNDSLDAIADKWQSVSKLGEDRVYEAVQQYLEAHNAIVGEIASELVEPTTDYVRRYGGMSAAMVMQPLGEGGVLPVQKTDITYDVLGFPIWRNGLAVQWNRDYFRRVSGEGFANLIRQMTLADLQGYYRAIRNALFFDTNTIFDNKNSPLTDGVDIMIPVKVLANGDTAGWNSGATVYPLRPDNTVVPSNHNHLMASDWGSASTATQKADLIALIANVTEHNTEGMVHLVIPKNLEQNLRTIGVPDFYPYTDPRIILSITSDQLVDSNTLDIRSSFNRRIGIFHESEVWVKQWAPSNYILCYIDDGGRKPLAMRIRDEESSKFNLVADDEDHPLRAQQFEREFGISVQERVKAAVLYTGGASYVAPVF